MKRLPTIAGNQLATETEGNDAAHVHVDQKAHARRNAIEFDEFWAILGIVHEVRSHEQHGEAFGSHRAMMNGLMQCEQAVKKRICLAKRRYGLGRKSWCSDTPWSSFPISGTIDFSNSKRSRCIRVGAKLKAQWVAESLVVLSAIPCISDHSIAS